MKDMKQMDLHEILDWCFMSCPCIYVMEGDVDDSGGLLI